MIIDIEDDAMAFNLLTDAPDIDTESDLMDRPVGGLGIHIVKRMVTDITTIDPMMTKTNSKSLRSYHEH